MLEKTLKKFMSPINRIFLNEIGHTYRLTSTVRQNVGIQEFAGVPIFLSGLKF